MIPMPIVEPNVQKSRLSRRDQRFQARQCFQSSPTSQSAFEFNITRVKVNNQVRQTPAIEFDATRVKVNIGARQSSRPSSSTLLASRSTFSPAIESAVEFNITRVRSKNRGGSRTRTGARAGTRKGAIETNKKIASNGTLRFRTRGRHPGSQIRRRSLVTA